MSRELNSTEGIETFFDDGWIDEVLFPVKSGKEATVYCCRASPARGLGFAALKVYTPAPERSFRNDTSYTEDRGYGDARTTRAVNARSRFGRVVRASAWVAREFYLLERLAAAGVSVPSPYAMTDTAILMELVSEGDKPAPQLVKVRLSPPEAERLLDQVLADIERMLACHIVHGDLSAYNILVADGRARIIDLPQAVDARTNRHAARLLARDVANVARYFRSQGADADPGDFAERLWALYQNAWR